ncbi:hypothetical protein H8D30_06875 [bacterium]|nr:hypothetical protein [bacterium]
MRTYKNSYWVLVGLLAFVTTPLFGGPGRPKEALDEDGGGHVTIQIQEPSNPCAGMEAPSSEESSWEAPPEMVLEEEEAAPESSFQVYGGGLFGDLTGYWASASISIGSISLHISGSDFDVASSDAFVFDLEYSGYRAGLGWDLPWMEGLRLEGGAVGGQTIDSGPAFVKEKTEGFGYYYGFGYGLPLGDGGGIFDISIHGYSLENQTNDDTGIAFSGYLAIPMGTNFTTFAHFDSGMEMELPNVTNLPVPMSLTVGGEYAFSDSLSAGVAWHSWDPGAIRGQDGFTIYVGMNL